MIPRGGTRALHWQSNIMLIPWVSGSSWYSMWYNTLLINRFYPSLPLLGMKCPLGQGCELKIWRFVRKRGWETKLLYSSTLWHLIMEKHQNYNIVIYRGSWGHAPKENLRTMRANGEIWCILVFLSVEISKLPCPYLNLNRFLIGSRRITRMTNFKAQWSEFRFQSELSQPCISRHDQRTNNLYIDVQVTLLMTNG